MSLLNRETLLKLGEIDPELDAVGVHEIQISFSYLHPVSGSRPIQFLPLITLILPISETKLKHEIPML